MMLQKKLLQIRALIRLRHYEMSAHATEEMAEDNLDIFDVEQAVINGQIVRIEKDDPRGTKYVIEGTAVDQLTPIGVVGRFLGDERYLIITVYEVTELER
jgi:Domain of unknown function (DUF4258)